MPTLTLGIAEVRCIYSENANSSLPLQEHKYREIISAEYMVFGRKGLGAPKVKEVRRCIAKAITALGFDRDRVELSSEEIAEADEEREEEFKGP